ncbi:MAG: CbiX/SirB N-terminal domain-containing protein [Deltaproteobacteria bacterium]|nr:CbiX/SirB N-terminal domain-containing protein [Deltaproteobacteria bacterium]
MDRDTTGNKFSGEAVILLGHGSRLPGAGKAMEQVAARLRERGKYILVEVCHMSLQKPSLSEALEKCATVRAGKVVVIPYFLHEGQHLLEDIPGMLREKVRGYPDVTMILGKNLGYDESLVDLVEKRATESLSLRDVREMMPRGRERSASGPEDPGHQDRGGRK